MSLKIQFIKWHSAILEPSNLSQRAGGHWSFLSNHTGSVAARETLVVGEKGLCNCEGVEASLGSKEAAKEGWHSQGQAAIIYRMRHTTAHQIRIPFSHCISLTTVMGSTENKWWSHTVLQALTGFSLMFQLVCRKQCVSPQACPELAMYGILSREWPLSCWHQGIWDSLANI